MVAIAARDANDLPRIIDGQIVPTTEEAIGWCELCEVCHVIARILSYQPARSVRKYAMDCHYWGKDSDACPLKLGLYRGYWLG